MKRVRLRDAARRDIDDIAAYIARDNPRRALTFAIELRARCDRISLVPEGGRPRPELGPELRSVPFGNYLVVYLAGPDGVEVVRIVHGARDLKRLF